MLGSTAARVLINAALYVAGDVDSVAEGIGAALATFVKIGATLAVARLAHKVRSTSRTSSLDRGRRPGRSVPECGQA